jgi:molybdopterin synthase catalytic subunit
MNEVNVFVQGPIPPLLIAECIQRYSAATEIGGHSIFLGQIRADLIGENRVKAIEYTAYEEMALKVISEIKESMIIKHALSAVVIYHSLGVVSSGEICLLVITSAKHRKAAIRGCEETVERIKTDVPVWGKELFEDDSYQWKVNQ